MMNNAVKAFVTLFFSLSLYFLASSQVPVDISQNKVSIDGKPFYIHMVKQGQTVYSICKAYNISEQQLVLHNPGIQYGLQVNQALKIPINPEKPFAPQEIKKEISGPDIQDTTLFIRHIVTVGETLYSLSMLYNVPQDTLITMNPGINQGLQAGTALLVPKLEYVEDTARFQIKIEEKTVMHQVAKKETLFSISKKYNIEISAIMLHNKELLWDGLKEGMVVKIPLVDTVIIDIWQQALTESTRYNNLYFRYFTGRTESSPINIRVMQPNNATYKVALMLPFNYDRIVELTTYIDTCKNRDQVRWAQRRLREIKARTDFCTDYYLGVLLAIDSVKKMGLPVELQVYDTQGDSIVTAHLINKHRIENVDLVLGPMENQCVNVALSLLGNTGVHLVLPFTSGVAGIENYMNVYQVFPSQEALNEYFTYYLAAHYGQNIILIGDNDSIGLQKLNEQTKNIKSYLDFYQIKDSVKIHQLANGNNIRKSLAAIMSKDKENILVVSPENEAAISNLIREITYMRGDYKLSVVGQPRWQRMINSNNLNTEYLHQLNVAYFSPFYIDYNHSGLNNFLAVFRTGFHSEPYTVSAGGINPLLLGYDNGLYFLARHIKPEYALKSMLLADYNFVKVSPLGGYENITATLVRFENDFSVSAFKKPKYNSLNPNKTE